MIKNAFLYTRLREPAALGEHLGKALDRRPHTPPGPQDLERFGFVAPCGGPMLETLAPSVHVIAGKQSYRDLPSAVVNEETARRVAQLDYPVGRKERQGIKDEVVFDLLPKCFIKHRRVMAVLTGDMVLVDAPTRALAETLLSALREALGSLKAVPLTTHDSPAQTMTDWLHHGCPVEALSVGTAATLKAGKDDRTASFKDIDLQDPEVIAHLEAGMHVTKLALRNDQIDFTLNDALELRGIKFGDDVHDRITEDTGDSQDARDHALSSLAITVGVLRHTVRTLVDAMGGEVCNDDR